MAGRLEHTLNAILSGQPSSRAVPTVAVAMANNPEVAGCIGRAMAEGLANFILVGPTAEVKRTAAEAEVDITGARIVDENDPVEASREAARLVSSGSAGVIMKGLVQTADFVRAVLDRSFGLLPEGALISHVAITDPPGYHKLLFLTDAAINVQPTVDDKLQLVRNAVQVAKQVGITRPKVACVAPVEKVSEKVPSTVDAALLVERCAKDPGLADAIVEGPFGLDVAISREAASIKGLAGAVAGDADILLAPGLDAGNVLYKSISVIAGGMVAGVVAGARVPIVLTSRADSEESKYCSLLLALTSALGSD